MCVCVLSCPFHLFPSREHSSSEADMPWALKWPTRARGRLHQGPVAGVGVTAPLHPRVVWKIEWINELIIVKCRHIVSILKRNLTKGKNNFQTFIYCVRNKPFKLGRLCGLALSSCELSKDVFLLLVSVPIKFLSPCIKRLLKLSRSESWPPAPPPFFLACLSSWIDWELQQVLL